MSSETPDASEKTLKSRVQSAFLWSFGSGISLQATKFVGSIVLARLLDPEHFGLLGMLAIVIALADRLMQGGLGAALIHKETVTEADRCTLFYSNLIVSVILYGILFSIAPWVATFLGHEILSPILRIVALRLLIGALGLVQSMSYRRDLNFKSLTVASMTADIGSFAVAITMAATGWGIWALVARTLSRQALSVIALWYQSSWRPSLIYSMQSFRDLYGYGSKVLLNSSIEVTFRNIHTTLIGKVWAPAVAGFYTRAKGLQDLPTSALMRSINTVAFPTYSRVRGQHDKTLRVIGKSIKSSYFLLLPILAFLGVFAYPLVRLLLGERWLPSAPLLQVFVLIGCFTPMINMCGAAFKASDRVGTLIRIRVTFRSLSLLSLYLTYTHGVQAILWGEFVVLAASGITCFCAIARLFDAPAPYFLKPLLPLGLATAIMTAAMSLLTGLQFPNPILLLISGATVGAVVYCGACRYMGVAELDEAIGVAGKILRRRQKSAAS